MVPRMSFGWDHCAVLTRRMLVVRECVVVTENGDAFEGDPQLADLTGQVVGHG